MHGPALPNTLRRMDAAQAAQRTEHRAGGAGDAGTSVRTPLSGLVEGMLGSDLPVRIRLYDGSAIGDPDAACTVVVRSPDALRRIVWAPGELGFGRAFVAGDIDVEGDIFDGLALRDRFPNIRIRPGDWWEAIKSVGPSGLRPLPPPPEEAHLHGRLHSPERDAAAIAHHYDVSNDFYRLVLGPSMTYSCAVWSDPSIDLADAQANKYELICRKLGLGPGMRLLDVGCGWGGMVKHAAKHHGVTGVGVTLSRRQAEWAEKDLADAGLSDKVEIRVQDYRDIADGPYDAISSIGMFEHVGLARLGTYFESLYRLLAPGGRLLNHGISSPPRHREPLRYRLRRRHRISPFIDHYVFPDGELHEVGEVTSAIQATGFEVRHLETLREHYALTLRAWVANLQANWDDAVAEAGAARARIWLLYMAASAINFEGNRTQVHQILATKTPGDDSPSGVSVGDAGMALRPDFGI